MKTFKIFFALMMVCLFAAQVNAQIGDPVLSVVEIQDNGDGTAYLYMQISGDMSTTLNDVTFTVEGPVIPGGSYTALINHNKLMVPNPVIEAIIPMGTLSGNQVDIVDVEISYAYAGYKSRKRSKKACCVKQAGNKEHPFMQ